MILERLLRLYTLYFIVIRQLLYKWVLTWKYYRQIFIASLNILRMHGLYRFFCLFVLWNKSWQALEEGKNKLVKH